MCGAPVLLSRHRELRVLAGTQTQPSLENPPVTAPVSAAVPAPQHRMLSAMKWIFSQFLSATVEPAVERVSAPRTTPSCDGCRTVVCSFSCVAACLGRFDG